MTYSIVARDPATGQLGVAVQSHYLGVGPVVPWLAPGVGAIATQARVDIAFGPIGLELLRNGRSAEQVVAALLASDATPEVRQVGVVDTLGQAAAYTGAETIPAAGHLVGDGFTVQGNLLERDTCWPAMARAYEAGLAEDLPFSERLLRALEAAEAEGGDVRGRQSSAIVIVEGTLQPNAWKGRVLDARVDDHPDPVPELRRIVNLYEAYALFDPDQTDLGEAEAYAEARRRAPEAMELVFWMGIEHAKRGEIDDARRELAIAFAADSRWRTTLQHLADAGREGMSSELAAQLVD
ncbi:MAG TPA: DUF1028 domain-containing protein [Candidatus Limnocylindria bacterium]|nr:DUF1028 domain-containing protein [Candidatus Limnocylindria bacterium]